MSYFYLIFPCFSILIGIVMTLIGFKLYMPSTDEETKENYIKYSLIYKMGGIALLCYGIMTLLLELKAL